MGAISPDDIWTGSTQINAFLTDIYGRTMPTWPTNVNTSEQWRADEADAPGYSLTYMQGTATIASAGVSISNTYSVVDRINYFLENIDNVKSTVLSDAQKKQLRGQALFLRAWTYWKAVKQIGGVPLILKTQNALRVDSLFVPRNRTSECINQMVADLDSAVSLLPNSWTGTNYGRADQCAAAALKGRILLWWASPLFDPNQNGTFGNKSRWQAAYDANTQAKSFCDAAGKKLLTDFSKIWTTKGAANTEALMLTQYNYPDNAYNQNNMLPNFIGGASCDHNPTINQIVAFPRKDGTYLLPDIYTVNSTYVTANSAQLLNDLVNNMDKRFYGSIQVPGTTYPCTDLKNGPYLWGCQYYSGSTLKSLLIIQGGGTITTVNGAYFPLKQLTGGMTFSDMQLKGQNSFIEIRFAEVLMNLAECANELSNMPEAMNYLSQLRNRAGITKGAGTYGYGLDVFADSKAHIRELIFNERMAEFSQEGKRWDDLRRLRKFDWLTNTAKSLGSLLIVLNTTEPTPTATSFAWNQPMTNASVQAKFHIEYKSNVGGYTYGLTPDKSYMYFYPLSNADIQSSSALHQNAGWVSNADFDPLQ